jgi:hypothetical protein
VRTRVLVLIFSGISVLSSPFARKPNPPVVSSQPQAAPAVLAFSRALRRRIAAARQPARSGGHKGSRSLRTRRVGLWQQADEFGGGGTLQSNW